MSTQRVLVPGVYETAPEFERVLEQAEGNAHTDFEIEFVEDLRDRYKKWGQRMFFSSKQEELLDRIAWGGDE